MQVEGHRAVSRDLGRMTATSVTMTTRAASSGAVRLIRTSMRLTDRHPREFLNQDDARLAQSHGATFNREDIPGLITHVHE